MNSSNTYSARSIALALGIGEAQTTLAIQQMWLRPRVSDPNSTPTTIIVKGIQRGLNKGGCNLQVSGYLDNPTIACLSRVSGPDWWDKTWLKIGQDIIKAPPRELLATQSNNSDLSGISMGGQVGGLVIIAGVIFLALKFK